MKRLASLIGLIIVILTLVFAFNPAPVRADGIIIPEPPIICRGCPPPPPNPREVPYLTVDTHRVNVSIDNQVATTRVDQVFRNDSQWSLEGTYVFPMPENAAISDFAMWVNGERVEGQLYTKEEARRIYDEIVRRRRDPALLEYIGRDLFQASIFPIDPGDTRRVQIEYSQILPVDNGLVQYVYPLSTERFSHRPLESVAITVDIASREAIKAIYSPSHPVSIDRINRFNARAGWEDFEVKPSTDFSLFYSISPDDVGVNLLSTKERGEDGFFTLLVAPNVDAEQVVDKDVILVLDVSGSMEGEKMDQAQDALRYVLDHLNEGDRFNIISFSTGVRAFSTRPEPLSELRAGRRFVDDLRPEGSTDINRALLEAIDGADRERPTIIIFLTDGLPTSGVVETPLILNNIEQAATGNLRIFPFGVGDDVDTILLDSLAQQQRGTSAYVRPGERVDEQVSGFYAKVSTPVLADISLEVDGVRIEDTYPFPLPDLFAGSQLIVAGRYREGGPATITLSGEINGRSRTFRFDDLTFASEPQQRQSAAFIPRLWATRKVGHLLNQIRLNGENRELIDEIVDLSVRYGIITPYTSFLVEEPEMALSREGRSIIADEAFAEAEEAAAEPASGVGAVDKAVAQNSLAEADMAAATPLPLATATAGLDRAGSGTSAAAAVTTVDDRAFVLKNGIWTDTTFDPTTMTTTELPFPSDRFLEFLNERPESGKYFALGSRVIIVIDGTAYETVEGEADETSEPLPQPDAVVPDEPTPEPAAGAVTSPRPANAAEVYTALTADVVEGAAPLTVNFAGELVGGPDDSQEFYCVESMFEYGDGIAQSAIPDCVEWEPGIDVQRRFTSNYIYDEPGEYQVTFSLAGVESEPVTIVVTGDEAGEVQPADAFDEPGSTMAQTTPASPDQSGSPESSGETGTTNCVLGMLSLAVLGLAFALWRKGDVTISG